MNVVVLWKFWNHYLEASLDDLSSIPDVRVLLCEISNQSGVTVPGDRHAAIERCDLREGETAIGARLEKFAPDLILICGWNVSSYRRLARHWRGRAVRVLYMDNQWLRTARQLVSVPISPFYLWPCFDAAFVTGARQERFAHRLGFTKKRTQNGGIVADTRVFRGDPGPSGFLFVGRLVHEKGVDLLVDAYRHYRAGRTDPWPLVVCGLGPEQFRLAGVEGLRPMGFVRPSLLRQVMSNAACLVLPSRFEPFGVVVHEATSMGLQIITTDAVGAADLYVDDCVNGRIVPSEAPLIVAESMTWMHDQTLEARRAGIQRSHDLASRQSPRTWSEALLSLDGRFDLTRRGVLRARLKRGHDAE